MKKVKHVCRRCGFLSVFAAGPVEVVKCARCGEIQDVEQPRCQGCGKKIDPDVCWCGDEIDRHTGYEGHSPVPWGCECGFAKMETSEND